MTADEKQLATYNRSFFLFIDNIDEELRITVIFIENAKRSLLQGNFSTISISVTNFENIRNKLRNDLCIHKKYTDIYRNNNFFISPIQNRNFLMYNKVLPQH